MKTNKIIKVNNLPSVKELEISLNITDKILSTAEREWWDKLELNWKIILLSNYCFNHKSWNLVDCDHECPGWGTLDDDNPESAEQYLIGFAIWKWGSDLSYNEYNVYLINVPRDILSFIINETRFLWCSRINVETITPLKRMKRLKDIQDLACVVSENQIEKIKLKYDYFQWFDTRGNEYKEIGKKKTWYEYNENKMANN